MIIKVTIVNELTIILVDSRVVDIKVKVFLLLLNIAVLYSEDSFIHLTFFFSFFLYIKLIFFKLRFFFILNYL